MSGELSVIHPSDLRDCFELPCVACYFGDGRSEQKRPERHGATRRCLLGACSLLLRTLNFDHKSFGVLSKQSPCVKVVQPRSQVEVCASSFLAIKVAIIPGSTVMQNPACGDALPSAFWREQTFKVSKSWSFCFCFPKMVVYIFHVYRACFLQLFRDNLCMWFRASGIYIIIWKHIHLATELETEELWQSLTGTVLIVLVLLEICTLRSCCEFCRILCLFVCVCASYCGSVIVFGCFSYFSLR